MGALRMFDFTVSELETFGDLVKDVVLSALINDGLVSVEDAVKWCKVNTVAMRKPSKVSRFYAKLKGEEKEDYLVTVAKLAEPLDWYGNNVEVGKKVHEKLST